MAILTDIQRAMRVLDTLHSADTTTGVDTELAIRIGNAVVSVRTGIDPSALSNEKKAGAIIWELRRHIKRLLADAEGNADARAARQAADAEVAEIDLGVGGEPEVD